jgi:hypothetical protein
MTYLVSLKKNRHIFQSGGIKNRYTHISQGEGEREKVDNPNLNRWTNNT